MGVPKKCKMIVKNEIPNQTTSNPFRFEKKIYTTCHILNQKFYKVSVFV